MWKAKYLKFKILEYSENREHCESESCSVLPDSLWPHGHLQARIMEWGSLSLLQGIFPALQVDSLPAEPQVKPESINTGTYWHFGSVALVLCTSGFLICDMKVRELIELRGLNGIIPVRGHYMLITTVIYIIVSLSEQIGQILS